MIIISWMMVQIYNSTGVLMLSSGKFRGEGGDKRDLLLVGEEKDD
jgi:hypothetical protein